MAIDTQIVLGNPCEESEAEEGEEAYVEEQVKELFEFLAEHQNLEETFDHED